MHFGNRLNWEVESRMTVGGYAHWEQVQFWAALEYQFSQVSRHLLKLTKLTLFTEQSGAHRKAE